jgi:anti-sigma factor RsiW
MSDDRLHDYFDGELTGEERVRFERALLGDAELRERLRELRELDEALLALPGHAAPADFTDRVVRAARRRGARLLRLLLPLAAAAAVVLAVLVGSRTDGRARPAEIEALDYVWEADVETYTSLALTDMEDLILAELEGS